MSKIVVTEAIQNVEPAAPMRQLVDVYDIPPGHFQANIPLWNRMSAAATTEGVDLASPTTVQATVRTVTASRHGVLSFISDRLQHQNNENVLSQVGVMHGRAVGRLLDSDLLTLLDGFSNTAPGAGSDATFLHIAGAVSFVRSDNNTAFGPAPSRPNAVLSPEQIRLLVQEAAGMQAAGTTMSAQPIPTGLSEEVIKAYWRGNDPLFGVPIYEDGNIDQDVASGGDAKGGVFAMKALHLAIEQEIRAADERDESLFGTEVVSSGVWGEGESVDEWGVEVFSAADPVFA
jgi:hypothetical protein